MSRFNKKSHVIRHCQYHIVRVPKYRHRILKGEVKEEVKKCIHVFCSMNGSKVEELKIQEDHVHLVLKIPPKVSVSDIMGVIKGVRR